ncbi:hypothetical protein GGS23DRAFT_611798 [Durotheca rogersii]|uniref:uncharacterized protein n=1 Tax=Durotheca rogersii TaxID=419775 RepID=UPI00221E595D|nr:uncharacterized protein GGS23DRAFT_611798 [Durotheca rogersii]KAI5861665.1 hypothetical protein GGS23DRAFT_611798 [Durotheca rogersii]
MASRNLPPRQIGEPRGSGRSMQTAPYQHLPPRHESTPAYDSHRASHGAPRHNPMPYREVISTPAHGSEFRSSGGNKSRNSDDSSGLTRWFAKKVGKPVETREKLHISEPLLISAPRSIGVQSSPQATPDAGEPRSRSRDSGSVTGDSVRRENLGASREALGSHPVPKRSRDMKGRAPARHTIPPTAGNGRDRPNLGSTEPVMTKDDVHERRKGRIFSGGEIADALHEFPDPEAWPSQDKDAHDSGFWEDAGFGDDDTSRNNEVTIVAYDPAIEHSNAPMLTITTVGDDENAVSPAGGNSISRGRLVVDDCYERLWAAQQKETRRLRRLLPLADLVAGAEDVGPNGDPGELEEALRTIIDDREALLSLMPLAQALADDQRIDIDDLEALPLALDRVLEERNSARSAANHHKRMTRALEARVAELEREMDRLSLTKEEYVRL